ncbi:MAG TPA: hydrogenase maturation protease [Mucilaginibacter sp.]|jgi:hydrogenase maturation protease|nr:hydrogenase maturation protease [Mucilaginibacter sp.]
MNQRTSPAETLLICIGNDYREDDGLGLYIGRQPKIKALAGIRILENSGDGMAMMDAWKDAGTVIIVDAVHSGRPAGTIFRFDAINNPLPANIFAVSTHHVGIPECIALSRSLGLLPEKLIFYGIEGENFGQSTELSPIVKEAANAVVNSIAEELSGCN